MKYKDYAALAHRGAELSERGDHEEAVNIFRKLVDSDLAAPDRVVMCINIATIYSSLKNTDAAMEWYDRAVEIENLFHGRQALESRAVYLAQTRMNSQSLEEFEKLLQHPSLFESDRERIRKYIFELSGRVGVL